MNEAQKYLLREVSKLDAKTASSTSNEFWNEQSSDLIEHILGGDLNEFLRWKVISETMLFCDKKKAAIEKRALQNSPLYKERYKSLLRDPLLGNPKRYSLLDRTTANTIHHVYHLYKYEIDQVLPESPKYFFEYGGGYGNLARIMNSSSVDSTYVIYDLPVFSKLQHYYLQINGLKSFDDLSRFPESGIYCLHEKSLVHTVLKFFENIKNDKYFIATWSLSETNLDQRLDFEQIKLFKNYIIAYQDTFEGIDNHPYFERLKSFCSSTRWKDSPISHLAGNHYLFGYDKGS